MSTDSKIAKITANNCILLICDLKNEAIQDLLEFGKIVNNSFKLMKILKLMGVPMISTEYKPGLAKHSVYINNDDFVISRYILDQYNMCIPAILSEIDEYVKMCSDVGSDPFHVILIGFETHIAVENTAIDFRNHGFEVYIVADCSTSRSRDDRLLAFQRMRDNGCQITTVESIVSKMIGDPENCEEYKNIRDELVTPSKSTDLFPLFTHL